MSMRNRLKGSSVHTNLGAPPPYEADSEKGPGHAPSAPPLASNSRYIVHKVGPGDSLVSIAVRYNTTVNRVRRANPDVVFGSQKLDHVDVVRIPRGPGVRDKHAERQAEGAAVASDEGAAVPSDEGAGAPPRRETEYRMIKAFQTKVRCDEFAANYYMRECNHDLDKAVDKWHSDRRWELERLATARASAPPLDDDDEKGDPPAAAARVGDDGRPPPYASPIGRRKKTSRHLADNDMELAPLTRSAATDDD